MSSTDIPADLLRAAQQVTELVLAEYVRGENYEAVLRPGFVRGMNEHISQALLAERERAAKLLEANTCNDSISCPNPIRCMALRRLAVEIRNGDELAARIRRGEP